MKKQIISGRKPEFSDYQLALIESTLNEKFSQLNARSNAIKSQVTLTANDWNSIALISYQMDAISEISMQCKILRECSFEK